MAINQDLPATDSATALHELIGQDSTATFENDPKFVDANATGEASSENLQTGADRQDVRNMPSIAAAKTVEDDDDEEDEDDEDEDDADDEDDLEDEDDEDDEDLDDEDDDDDDDLEDEDDDEEDEDDEDEDDE